MLIFTRTHGTSFHIGDTKITVYLLEYKETGETIDDEIQLEIYETLADDIAILNSKSG